jgi:F-type H+-transporting ATPase subunit epsilon
MRLRIIAPTRVEVDEEVDSVSVHAEDGAFGLLPHHVDFVSVLVPGLLGYGQGERERFVAVDGGLLVKRGSEVHVATPRATHGAELGDLRRLVRELISVRSEQEERARRALGKLEADVVRRIVELEGKHGR